MKKQVMVKGPKQLLDAIPGLIGFIPSESIVLVTIGANNHVLVTARFEADSPPHSWIEALTGVVEAGAKGAFIVAVVEREPENLATFVVMAENVLDVHDVIIVSNGKAGSIRCQDPTCCPFPYVFEPLPIDPERQDGVVGSRKALEEALALHGPAAEPLPGSEDMVESVTSKVVRLLQADDPRSVDVEWLASGMVLLCSSIPTRDRLLAEVAKADPLPEVWLVEALAQRIDSAEALTILACFAYMTGAGAVVSILLERVKTLGGTTMADLLSTSNRHAMPPKNIRKVFATAMED